MPGRVAYDLLVDLCIVLPSNEMKGVRTSMANSFLVGQLKFIFDILFLFTGSKVISKVDS